MRNLVLGFYGEGPSDERFLPILIQRTAYRILLQQGREVVDVLEPLPIQPQNRDADHAHQIKNVAEQGVGYHAVIVHADADHRSRQSALEERFLPGFNLVLDPENERICRHLVPLIPVRMTEAWMLADADIFRYVVGTDKSVAELGLASHPAQVERDLNPKWTINQAIKIAFSMRRNRKLPSAIEYFEPLARQIRLDVLDAVPAYFEFVQDLSSMLKTLGYINDHA